MTFQQGADRALDCHWSADVDIIRRARMPMPASKAEAKAKASILACAVLEHTGERRRISYSRRNDWYSAAPRYAGLALSRRLVCSVVDAMQDMGLAYGVTATPGSHLKKVPLQSSFWATQQLIDLVGDTPLRHVGPRVPVVMRDAAGNLVDLPDTERARRMVKETETLNEYLKRILVDVAPEADPADWDRGTYHWKARKVRESGKVTWSTVTPTDPQVVRILSRERMDCNGRLYGFWQSLPKDRRKELRINHELIIEPDFAALHPSLLYAMEGIILGHDPYVADLQRWSRSAGKLALNVAINAKSIPGAVQALLVKRDEEGSDGTPKWKHGARETRALIDALIERNRPIAHRICSDAGIRLMGIDSRMCVDVLKRCRKDGVAVLPVHDSFMVGRSNEATVTGHMASVLEETRVGLYPIKSMVSARMFPQMPPALGRPRVPPGPEASSSLLENLSPEGPGEPLSLPGNRGLSEGPAGFSKDPLPSVTPAGRFLGTADLLEEPLASEALSLPLLGPAALPKEPPTSPPTPRPCPFLTPSTEPQIGHPILRPKDPILMPTTQNRYIMCLGVERRVGKVAPSLIPEFEAAELAAGRDPWDLPLPVAKYPPGPWDDEPSDVVAVLDYAYTCVVPSGPGCTTV